MAAKCLLLLPACLPAVLYISEPCQLVQHTKYACSYRCHSAWQVHWACCPAWGQEDRAKGQRWAGEAEADKREGRGGGKAHTVGATGCGSCRGIIGTGKGWSSGTSREATHWRTQCYWAWVEGGRKGRRGRETIKGKRRRERERESFVFHKNLANGNVYWLSCHRFSGHDRMFTHSLCRAYAITWPYDQHYTGSCK